MTETQAASSAAGASTNPGGAEPADGGDNAGSTTTGRSVVGRAAVPAETQPPKFTRAPGMAPPPVKLDGAENPAAGDRATAKKSGSDAGTAPVAAPGVGHTTGRATVASTSRVTPPPLAPPAPGPFTPAGAASRLRAGFRAVSAGRSSAVSAAKAGAAKIAPRKVAVAAKVAGAARVADAARAARGTVSAAASRGPRRARLFVKRIDPWSVMKFSFAVSFVLFFVAIVATSVLYLAVDAMHVIESLNKTLADVLGANGGKGTFKVTATGVIGTAGVLGLVNVVLFTALATLGAFVYNVCADLVGGVEVTLSERD
jgi:hypothetical protein